MHTFIQPLTEGKIITRAERMDDVEIVALSEELGEPVSQLQTGFFPDPEFTVFRTADVRLVIARLEHRLAQIATQAEKLTTAKQYAESLR